MRLEGAAKTEKSDEDPSTPERIFLCLFVGSRVTVATSTTVTNPLERQEKALTSGYINQNSSFLPWSIEVHSSILVEIVRTGGLIRKWEGVIMMLFWAYGRNICGNEF